MELLEKLIDKKELRTIDKELVNRLLEEAKKENLSLYKKLEEKKFNERSKEYREFKKVIRKKLRTIYGMFTNETLGKRKKEILLENKEYEKIMKSHLSTFERLRQYPVLYKFLETELGKPKKVVDLGCGYNPFSYKMLNEDAKYFATDISTAEMRFIQEYFTQENIRGTTKALDLTEKESLKIIKEQTEDADWTLMFKLLDTLESMKRGSSADLINNIKSKFIIISFPTRTISSKNKIRAERKWLDNSTKHLKLVNSQEIGSEQYLLFRTNE